MSLLTAIRTLLFLPDRANLVPHQNARALYSMAHANLADRPHSGALAVLVSAIETSSNPNDREVSKQAFNGKRRGGARNRADRTNYGLTATQVGNLHAAAFMAEKIGLPLNRFITVHWEAAGVRLENMARATGRFIDFLTRWLARQGHRTAWIWVHENGCGIGGHCHLLAYVPPDCVTKLTAAQKRWLRRITGKPNRKGVIKSSIIGGRLGLEISNPDLYFANLETALAYVIKQADIVLTRGFHQPGGQVIGKRCGTSQNIGAKARGQTFQE